MPNPKKPTISTDTCWVNVKGADFMINNYNLVKGIELLKNENKELQQLAKVGKDVKTNDQYFVADETGLKIKCVDRSDLTKIRTLIGENKELINDSLTLAQRCSVAERSVRAKQSQLEQQAVESNNLSDHEGHMCKMLVRMMRGETVEFNNTNDDEWCEATELSINTDWKYRKPVNKLVMPWGKIDNKYKFGIINDRDQLFVSEEPFVDGLCNPSVSLLVDDILEVNTDGVNPWTTCKRPVAPRDGINQLIVPWDKINTIYEFVAMDENGSVYGYFDEPNQGLKLWTVDGDCLMLDDLNINTDGVYWRKSLTKRPE